MKTKKKALLENLPYQIWRLCKTRSACTNDYHKAFYTASQAAIKNANTIEESRSKINRNSVFSIAICRPTGDKWQSKTLFLSIFDPHSSTVDNIFDCRLPGVLMYTMVNPGPVLNATFVKKSIVFKDKKYPRPLPAPHLHPNPNLCIMI